MKDTNAHAGRHLQYVMLIVSLSFATSI